MTDTMTYKDFKGSIHFSDVDNVFYGKIEGINDLVTYEARSKNKLTTAFQEAVDDFISICRDTGKSTAIILKLSIQSIKINYCKLAPWEI